MKKFIKTYEEFNWHDLAQPGNIMVIKMGLYGLVGYYASKYLSKYLINKEVISKLKDPIYTKRYGNRLIEREGDLVKIYHTLEKKEQFILNIKTREISYVDDNQTDKDGKKIQKSAKLNDSDYKQLMDGIKFVEGLGDIKELYQDLDDFGFNVEIRYTDFFRREFALKCIRKDMDSIRQGYFGSKNTGFFGDEEDTIAEEGDEFFHYPEDQGDHDMFEGVSKNFDDFMDILESSIERIEDELKVSITPYPAPSVSSTNKTPSITRIDGEYFISYREDTDSTWNKFNSYKEKNPKVSQKERMKKYKEIKDESDNKNLNDLKKIPNAFYIYFKTKI